MEMNEVLLLEVLSDVARNALQVFSRSELLTCIAKLKVQNFRLSKNVEFWLRDLIIEPNSASDPVSYSEKVMFSNFTEVAFATKSNSL